MKLSCPAKSGAPIRIKIGLSLRQVSRAQTVLGAFLNNYIMELRLRNFARDTCRRLSIADCVLELYIYDWIGGIFR